MKLSANMLNFLGYMYADRPHAWCDHREAVGLAYPFGVKSALKNGLIEPATFTLEPPVGIPPIPGAPYGKTWDGYRLTVLGRKLGAIGARMRALHEGYNGPSWPPYIKDAQALFDREKAKS